MQHHLFEMNNVCVAFLQRELTAKICIDLCQKRRSHIRHAAMSIRDPEPPGPAPDWDYPQSQ
jgi:hypothetical protein